MHRIDHETATSDHKFTEGNPTIPVPATVVTDDWLNAVQEELVAVITGAGLELEKSDNTQLWQAITTAVDNALPGLATTKNPGLVQIGDGLAITPQGLLSVVIASTSQAGLVKPRYGLKIGKDGSLDVDFGDMPTDKFEELLKSIRVPIWLTKPLTVYVATTGSDTLDDGRGLTEDKPFATLQAALNYISDTYNLSRHNVTVRLAEGDYGRKTVSLPSYTASTGEIYIQGADANDKEKTKIGRVNLNYSHTYHLVDLACKPEGSNVTTSGVAPSAGFVYLQNVMVDISETVMSGNANIIGLNSTLTGTIYINATAEGVPNGVVFKVSEACPPSSLLNTSGGQIMAYADINVVGSTTLSAFALARQLGKIQFLKSASPNPGRLPVVTVADGGQVTGTRYIANLNGIIDTSGQGADFFPGTTAGRTETGGQYN